MNIERIAGVKRFRPRYIAGKPGERKKRKKKTPENEYARKCIITQECVGIWLILKSLCCYEAAVVRLLEA